MSDGGFGTRLRATRRRLGLTQRQAAGAELTASYVSLLESGKRTPTAAAVLALCRSLGVQPVDLGAESLVDVEVGADRDRRRSVTAGLELDLRWAKIAVRAGNPASAETYARRVFEHPDVDQATQLDALAVLAAATEGQGRIREAIALGHQLDDQLDPGTGRTAWLSVQAMLLRCYKTTGDYAHAIDVGERAMARFGTDVGEEEMLLVVSLADAHTERGDFTRAQMYLTTILSRAEQAGSLRVRGSALWNASIVASEAGRHDDAVEAAERALALLGESDAARNLGRLHANLADVLLERGGAEAPARARDHLTQALALAREEAGVAETARIVLELARCELAAGDPHLARCHVLEARELLDHADDGAELDRAQVDLVDAHVAMSLGDRAGALALASNAGEVNERLDSRATAAKVWATVAELVRDVDEQAHTHALARSLQLSNVRATRYDRPASSLASAAEPPGGVTPGTVADRPSGPRPQTTPAPAR